MNWLIVGTGWISESFIKSLRNKGENVWGVFSRTKEKGQAFASKNNIENVLTTFDEVVGYDAVYIATPNIIHYDQAKWFIVNGYDVMVEKPMTHSYELTKELYDLADTNGVRLMEAFAHITNKEYENLEGSVVRTNLMQVSSKIKNNTYKEASSFSKELFGGVIPDLGVYPISASIKVLGKVLEANMKVNEVLNDVVVDCDISMTHENGKSSFRVSKTVDGDNAFYIDGDKVFDHINLSYYGDHRMDAEIEKFIAKDYNDIRRVSIETARVVDLLLK